MTSKAKVKGNSWERDCAAFLTKTYGDTFIRVSNSGAYIGGVNSFRKNYLSANQIQSSKGDIHTPDGWSKLVIECKSYKDFNFHHLFQGDNKQLDSWINQVNIASDPDDFNLILMKFNRIGKFVCIEEKNYTEQVQCSLIYKQWVFCDWDNFWKVYTNVILTKCKNHDQKSFEYNSSQVMSDPSN